MPLHILRRLLLIVAVVGAGLSSAQPAAAEFLDFGAGNVSCATSLFPQYDVSTESWIAGFWSGLNYFSVKSRTGLSSDEAGIVAEVRLYCRSHPSLKLLESVEYVYHDMMVAGR